MGGYAQLPEPGGINAQPAWLMAAFDILNAAEAEARKSRQDEDRGAQI
jgi:hypothetical protein